jgi:hypothetical protein
MGKFAEWLKSRKINEMMGSVSSIVSCKDMDSKDIQVQGSGSNLGCKKRKSKMLTMKFNGDNNG